MDYQGCFLLVIDFFPPIYTNAVCQQAAEEPCEYFDELFCEQQQNKDSIVHSEATKFLFMYIFPKFGKDEMGRCMLLLKHTPEYNYDASYCCFYKDLPTYCIVQACV